MINYAPIIDTSVPGFVLETDLKALRLKVHFKHNIAVSKNDIKAIEVIIKPYSQLSQTPVIARGRTKGTDTNHSYHNLDKGVLMLGSIVASNKQNIRFEDGVYYKIQIAYVDKSGNVGPYSSVGIARCLGRSNDTVLKIDGLSKDSTNSPRKSYVGIFEHDSDITETVYQYFFTLKKDADNKIIKQTGWLSPTFSNGNPVMVFDVLEDLELDKKYTLTFGIITVNGYSKEVSYAIKGISQEYPNTFKEKIIAIQDAEAKENGYIQIQLKPREGSIRTADTPCGNFNLVRKELNSNIWETLTNFKMTQMSNLDKFIWKDFSIESGKIYIYGIQQWYKDSVTKKVYYSDKVVSDIPITAEFEHIFLSDGKKQLRVAFNPKVSNLKTTTLENKVDTIGSKYPFFSRNGTVSYKEIPISGLISYHMDPNNYFISLNELGLMDQAQEKLTYDFGSDASFNTYSSQIKEYLVTISEANYYNANTKAVRKTAATGFSKITRDNKRGWLIRNINNYLKTKSAFSQNHAKNFAIAIYNKAKFNSNLRITNMDTIIERDLFFPRYGVATINGLQSRAYNINQNFYEVLDFDEEAFGQIEAYRCDIWSTDDEDTDYANHKWVVPERTNEGKPIIEFALNKSLKTNKDYRINFKFITNKKNDKSNNNIWRTITYRLSQNIAKPETNLTNNNFKLEKDFRTLVYDWLNDGNPKLFRSPQEGNYILRLMNITLTPNDTVGRMLYTFSGTGYEMDECNIDKLKTHSLISFNKLGSAQDFSDNWPKKFSRTYTINKSTSSDASYIPIIIKNSSSKIDFQKTSSGNYGFWITMKNGLPYVNTSKTYHVYVYEKDGKTFNGPISNFARLAYAQKILFEETSRHEVTNSKIKNFFWELRSWSHSQKEKKGQKVKISSRILNDFISYWYATDDIPTGDFRTTVPYKVAQAYGFLIPTNPTTGKFTRHATSDNVNEFGYELTVKNWYKGYGPFQGKVTSIILDNQDVSTGESGEKRFFGKITVTREEVTHALKSAFAEYNSKAKYGKIKTINLVATSDVQDPWARYFYKRFNSSLLDTLKSDIKKKIKDSKYSTAEKIKQEIETIKKGSIVTSLQYQYDKFGINGANFVNNKLLYWVRQYWINYRNGKATQAETLTNIDNLFKLTEIKAPNIHTLKTLERLFKVTSITTSFGDITLAEVLNKIQKIMEAANKGKYYKEGYPLITVKKDGYVKMTEENKRAWMRTKIKNYLNDVIPSDIGGTTTNTATAREIVKKVKFDSNLKITNIESASKGYRFWPEKKVYVYFSNGRVQAYTESGVYSFGALKKMHNYDQIIKIRPAKYTSIKFRGLVAYGSSAKLGYLELGNSRLGDEEIW